MFKERLEALSDLIALSEYTTRSNQLSPQEALQAAQLLLKQVKRACGKVYVIGNGGSAAIASHFCTDLLRTLEMAACVLSDPSSLTCFANDCGYENVYKFPLMRQLKAEDLVVAISSSGKSSNIVCAAEYAKERGAALFTLSGFSSDNPLRSLGDLNYWLPSHDYGLVETGHFFLLHTLIDALNPCLIKSNPLVTSLR